MPLTPESHAADKRQRDERPSLEAIPLSIGLKTEGNLNPS
jgi:hypothetical protein